MRRLKIAKKTLVMNRDEFKKFLKDKECYHYGVGWIERWHGVNSLLEYFPYNGFLLKQGIKLCQYSSSYPSSCLGHNILTKTGKIGKTIWKIQRWKVSITKAKNGNLYYVTRMGD